MAGRLYCMGDWDEDKQLRVEVEGRSLEIRVVIWKGQKKNHSNLISLLFATEA